MGDWCSKRWRLRENTVGSDGGLMKWGNSGRFMTWWKIYKVKEDWVLWGDWRSGIRRFRVDTPRLMGRLRSRKRVDTLGFDERFKKLTNWEVGWEWIRQNLMKDLRRRVRIHILGSGGRFMKIRVWWEIYKDLIPQGFMKGEYLRVLWRIYEKWIP